MNFSFQAEVKVEFQEENKEEEETSAKKRSGPFSGFYIYIL